MAYLFCLPLLKYFSKRSVFPLVPKEMSSQSNVFFQSICFWIFLSFFTLRKNECCRRIFHTFIECLIRSFELIVHFINLNKRFLKSTCFDTTFTFNGSLFKLLVLGRLDWVYYHMFCSHILIYWSNDLR